MGILGRVEMIVWSIPTMTVLLLSGIAWISSHDLDPARPLPTTTKPLTVEVVSLDWKWLFIYPEQGIASVNRLTIPANTPISFAVTSSGVMNSFFVPQLGSQIYAMAGMVTRLHLQADSPGTFRGLSAQFSGDGFSDMRFTVDAVAADQFASWIAATQSTGPTLDATTYAELAQPSYAPKPFTYRAVSPRLFETIVHPPDAVGASRVRKAGRRAHGGVKMLGKLSWSAFPINEPIDMVVSGLMILTIAGILLWLR
jgi:cytochrome o ubiquinol oxidase subunit II